MADTNARLENKASDGGPQPCPPPHPTPSKPSAAPPPLSCDTHCHVFGPRDRFPYFEGRPYDPPEAPYAKLRALHDHLDLDRAVVVQSAIHGVDNTAMLDALAQSGGRYRGVCNLNASFSEKDIEAMHAAGVRGVRFNFVRFLGGPPDLGVFKRVTDMVADFGWHVTVHAWTDDLTEHADLFGSLKLPVMLEHMCHIDPEAGLDQAPFRLLLEGIREHGWWSKIANGDRVSKTGRPYNDVVPYAQAIIETDPDRVIWGTDWPHPMYRGTIPDDGELVDLLYSYAPDAETLKKILVDNPARLYDF
jgi:2-pyrone-4,6-dicarboxylate lactonase